MEWSGQLGETDIFCLPNDDLLFVGVGKQDFSQRTEVVVTRGLYTVREKSHMTYVGE